MEPKNPDYMQAVQRIVDVAPFIQELEIQLADAGPGWCAMRVPLLTKHLQQDGYAHAGVYMTLADHTAGCAATTLVAADEYVLSAEFNISLLRATQGVDLFCRAEVVKPGRRLIVAESSVYAGDSVAPERLAAKARVALAVMRRRA